MRPASPAIKLPNSATLSPRLTFEHYFATELPVTSPPSVPVKAGWPASGLAFPAVAVG